MENRRKYKLPETLRQLMKKHPVTGKPTTQKELAEYIGIRPQSLALYVQGKTEPSAAKCLAIADYFGVSADYLLIGYEDGDIYFSMMDAQRRRMYERLGQIAVLCSQAENQALYLMETEVKPDVQE